MAAEKIQILAFVGSLNTDSTAHKIIAYIQKAFDSRIEITVFDSSKIPLFNPIIEKHNNTPQTVLALRNSVQNAAGILFCTPEYIFSLPANLKNIIEWCVSTTIFEDKPTAMIIAAASGEVAYKSLYKILKNLECDIQDQDSLLIKGAKGKIKNDVIDEKTTEQIKTVIEQLIEKIKL